MLRFLAIDDNLETLMLLEKMLSEYGECTTASNGQDAIREFEQAHLAKSPFHLIFLDIMMPGMDGHEVLQAIRRLEEEKFPAGQRAKITMITALGDQKNRFASYEQGCEYFMVKPIIKAEIVNIIEKTEEWFDVFSL